MTSALPSLASSDRQALNCLEFKSPRDNSERMKIVYKVLERLYESPDRELGKVEKKSNRICRLLYQNSSPKGIFICKDDPDNDCGKVPSLEIKVLELLDPKYDSSKGLCTELLQRVTEIAVSAKALAIHVKLLSTETGLFQFYARHGFTVIKEFPKSDSREVLQCVLQKSLSQPLPLAAVKEPVRLLVSLRENQPLTVGNYKPATLKNPYLPWIQQGKKTIEGRINAGMFSGVKAGDRFRFFNQSSEVFCRITSVKHYSSFEEMLAAENYKECIPQASSFEEAAGVYRQIPGYIERAKQSGVLALHLAVEPKPLLPTSSDQRRGIKRDRNGN